jgi:hypothetical protein
VNHGLKLVDDRPETIRQSADVDGQFVQLSLQVGCSLPLTLKFAIDILELGLDDSEQVGAVRQACHGLFIPAARFFRAASVAIVWHPDQLTRNWAKP